MQNACLSETGNAESLRRGQHFRFSIGSLVESVLLEPGQSPTGIRVKLALLLRKNLVESLVNKAQGSANSHRRTIAFKYFLEARKDGHARADCRLSEIHGSDVALL